MVVDYKDYLAKLVAKTNGIATYKDTKKIKKLIEWAQNDNPANIGGAIVIEQG